MSTHTIRRRRTALIGATAAALALAVATASGATTDPPTDSPTDPALDQTIGTDEAIGDEQVVIDSGHVDIGPRIIDGEWQLLMRDDTSAPPVWRYLDDVVLSLGNNAILPAPDDEQFGFIAAEPGADVYVIPQTQAMDVVWAGWNTQDPEVVADLPLGVTLRLHGVTGPGQFTLFLQSGNFDDAQLLWDSSLEEPQDIWADTNTHVHGNWVFTEPGIYLLDVEMLGELRDGETRSARSLLRFVVGDDADPQDAFVAESQTEVSESDGATGAATDGTDIEGSDEGTSESTDDGGALPLALIIGGGAAVLVLAGVLVAVLRSRRARMLAEANEDGSDG